MIGLSRIAQGITSLKAMHYIMVSPFGNILVKFQSE